MTSYNQDEVMADEEREYMPTIYKGLRMKYNKEKGAHYTGDINGKKVEFIPNKEVSGDWVVYVDDEVVTKHAENLGEAFETTQRELNIKDKSKKQEEPQGSKNGNESINTEKQETKKESKQETKKESKKEWSEKVTSSEIEKLEPKVKKLYSEISDIESKIFENESALKKYGVSASLSKDAGVVSHRNGVAQKLQDEMDIYKKIYKEKNAKLKKSGYMFLWGDLYKK